MEKKLNGSYVGEQVSNISLTVYDTQNITRALLRAWSEKNNGPIKITMLEYTGLVQLISTGSSDNWKSIDPLYYDWIGMSRYLYRDFLRKMINSLNLKSIENITFMLDGAEVGSVVRGKIMGIWYPQCRCEAISSHLYGPAQKLEPQKLNDALFNDSFEKVDIVKDRATVTLNQNWFFSGKMRPESSEIQLSPFLTYLACKAGDALVTIWLDMISTLGCSCNTELIISGGCVSGYRFYYGRVYNDWGWKTVHVDHYELYPKMQFMEATDSPVGFCNN